MISDTTKKTIQEVNLTVFGQIHIFLSMRIC